MPRKLSLPLTTAKHKYAILANAVASNLQMSKIDDSEEFKKSGIRLKTARVSASGIPEEAMSFQNIDWIELFENGNGRILSYTNSLQAVFFS